MIYVRVASEYVSPTRVFYDALVRLPTGELGRMLGWTGTSRRFLV